ncbi:hypothetical protein Tcan_01904 [Toxocara canis]|uniref:Uncharacterized protein n=1 Tax=Toxocara canis TaxID=6265 RepID=A0A0B2W3I4_TOXCA|nr:hypothetical protein Tcan_01904 [Toxocara canis]
MPTALAIPQKEESVRKTLGLLWAQCWDIHMKNVFKHRGVIAGLIDRYFRTFCGYSRRLKNTSRYDQLLHYGAFDELVFDNGGAQVTKEMDA